MPTQTLKILDGPLESQETFDVEDRLMRLYDVINVLELEYQGKRKVQTGKYYKYQITQQGLKYAT